MSAFDDRVREVIKDDLQDIRRLFLSSPEHTDYGLLRKMEECCDVLMTIDRNVKDLRNAQVRMGDPIRKSKEEPEEEEEPSAPEELADSMAYPYTNDPAVNKALDDRIRDWADKMKDQQYDDWELVTQLYTFLRDNLLKMIGGVKDLTNILTRAWSVVQGIRNNARIKHLMNQNQVLMDDIRDIKARVAKVGTMPDTKTLDKSIAQHTAVIVTELDKQSDALQKLLTDTEDANNALKDITKNLDTVGETVENGTTSILEAIAKCCSSLSESMAGLHQDVINNNADTQNKLDQLTETTNAIKTATHNIEGAVGGQIANTGAETNQRLRSVQSELHRIRGLVQRLSGAN